MSALFETDISSVLRRLNAGAVRHHRVDDESGAEEKEEEEEEEIVTAGDEETKEAERVTRSHGSRGGGSTPTTGGSGGLEALEITYTRRGRSGQRADVVRLNDVNDDLESRCA